MTNFSGKLEADKMRQPSRVVSVRKSVWRRLNSQARSASLPRVISGPAGEVPTTPIESVQTLWEVTGGEMVSVVAESISSDAAVYGAALLQLEFLDSSGRILRAPSWAHYSNRVGEYQYLIPGDEANPSLTIFSLVSPERAVAFRVTGHRWKAGVRTALVGELYLRVGASQMPVQTTAYGTRIPVMASEFHQIIPVRSGATLVNVSIDVAANSGVAKSPLKVRWLGEDGGRLMPEPELAQHRAHGPFIMLEAPLGGRSTIGASLEVPPNAAALEFEGVEWGAKTALVLNPVEVIVKEGGAQSPLEQFLADIPDDARLIVIDTTAPPLGHPTLALRPNNMAMEYAELGNWVIFLPFGSLQGEPARVSDRILQVDRKNYDAMFSSVLTRRAGDNNCYLCSSFSSVAAVATEARVRANGWRVVYEIRDDMEEFNRVGYSKWYHQALERRLMTRAQSVVTVSEALAEKVEVMTGEPRATVVPNAVRRATIRNNAELRTLSAWSVREKSNVVGYVGHLTESWFDWPLLLDAAGRFPNTSFEIVGHGIPEGLDLPDNVNYLGAKTHDEIIEFVSRWRVGLIPFIPSPLTRAVDPNKIYEYFAWGLRCISADMGSVDSYPSTRVYGSVDQFEDALREFLETPMTEPELEQLSEFVEAAGWDTRAKVMQSVIWEEVAR